MSGNHMQQVSASAPTQPLYNVPSLRKVLNARPQGGHFGFCVATTILSSSSICLLAALSPARSGYRFPLWVAIAILVSTTNPEQLNLL